MTRRDKLFHPATLISLIALFIALGGVGYAATKIGTNQIRNAAVTGKKMANNSITSRKLRASAVNTSDLANGAVTSPKIRNGAIISADLAVGAVLNADIANGAVTGAKIANETIGTQKLENGSVASDKIGTGAVIASKLGANSVTTPAIAPDSITANQIVNGQVVEGNGALSSTELALPNGSSNAPVLTFPGLGVLQLDCAAGVATVEFANNSGTSIDVRQWGVVNGVPDTPVVVSSNPANGGVIQQDSAPNGIMGITWMASFGGGTSLHVATINTSTKNVGAATCVISAQATYTS